MNPAGYQLIGFLVTVIGLIVVAAGAYIWLGAVGYFGMRGEYEWKSRINQGEFLLVLGAVFLAAGFIFVFLLGGTEFGETPKPKHNP